MYSDIQDLAEVKRGKQRRKVLGAFPFGKQLIVSEITHLVNENTKEHIRLSDISRTLKFLEKKGLVRCLNPPQKQGAKGILYELTGKGLKMQERL